MIYTVTLNPSLDYVMQVDSLHTGELNRSGGEALIAGGKGINVATVLTRMGVEATALGFVAGDTGAMLTEWLKKDGIASDFVTLPNGRTRINVKVCGQTETEINAKGPTVDDTSLSAFWGQIDHLQEGDALVLAGSLPAGLPTDFYGQVLSRLKDRKVYTVVDVAGKVLTDTLPHHPFLIKPNRAELEEWIGRPLPTRQDVMDAALQLQNQGARHVLISLGEEGALWLGENGDFCYQSAPKGKPHYTVGAGDSMVAGFIAAYLQTKDGRTALKMGVAAGSATAFAEGLATGEDIRALYDTLT